VHETFTLRRATRYGGFNALSDFVAAQGIDRALTDAFGQDKAPWATYSLPETLRHLLDGYLLGVERVWHFADLEQEPLLCVKRGRDRLPDHTLLYRELARFEAPGLLSRLRTVGEGLRSCAWRTRKWPISRIPRERPGSSDAILKPTGRSRFTRVGLEPWAVGHSPPPR